MNNTTDDTQEMLRLLRENYAARLPEKLKQIKEYWQTLEQSGWETETAQKLHALVHKLAGSGASYGFPEVSQTARDLEVYLEEILENQTSPTSNWQTEIKQMLDELYQATSEIES